MQPGGPLAARGTHRKGCRKAKTKVLTAYAPVAPLGWLVFVELPATEAYAPLYAALHRLALVLLAALGFAVLAGMFLAGRMVGPIQALRAGAERIGGGDLAQRIRIKTGDELEALADQFNDMAGRLAGILCRTGAKGRGAHPRSGGEEPPARNGEPAQVAIPRQYEP
jgi:methyl-accepting chemotaxis protein